MNKDYRELFNIFCRYILILITGFGNLFIFYKIFTPLTIQSFRLVLSIFSDPLVFGNVIVVGNKVVEIIPSCVAGAAYFLLFFLALSNKMELKKYFKVIGFLMGGFFILNMARLLILTAITDLASFEIIHWISWHLISTAFVVGLWILAVKLFKIKTIPVFSDLKFFVGLIKPKSKKKTKTNKKHKKSN